MLLANSVVGIKSPTEVSCVLVVAAVTALLVDSLTRELSVPCCKVVPAVVEISVGD